MYKTDVISSGPDTALKISTDNSTSIITKTLNRITDDFAELGYSIHYSGHPEEAYEHVLTEIKGIVEEVIKDGYHKLLDFLGRIDLSEKRIKETLSKHPNNSHSKIISKLIIEREFKKVCSGCYGLE